jgi:hypothetical protein
MFLNMSKKLFLNLAAIPAQALNLPERGGIFWRPARHPTLDALPMPEPPSMAQAPHDQKVTRSVAA